jgi:hypothetical protein
MYANLVGAHQRYQKLKLMSTAIVAVIIGI